MEDYAEGRKVSHEGDPGVEFSAGVRSVLRRLVARVRGAVDASQDLAKQALEEAHALTWPVGGGRVVSGRVLVPLLRTVPGIGLIGAVTWLSTIVDPTRFPSAKAVAAYAGCDPSLKVSAGKVTSFTRRRGNAQLHHALVSAAGVVLRVGGTGLAQWGRSIRGRHRKGGWAKACGAIARKLAVALWYVHKDLQAYDESKYGYNRGVEVDEVDLGEFPGLARFRKALQAGQIYTTAHLLAHWEAGEWPEGIGDKCLQKIKGVLSRVVVSSWKGPFTVEPEERLSPGAVARKFLSSGT
jgi:hypothetical protein